jgi:hypothetical protein
VPTSSKPLGPPISSTDARSVNCPARPGADQRFERDLPSVRLGTYRLFRRDAADRWIADARSPPTRTPAG